MNLDRLKDYVDGLSAEDKFEIVNGIEEYVYFEWNETFTVFMLTNDDYCEYGDTYPIDVVKEQIGDLYTIESVMDNY